MRILITGNMNYCGIRTDFLDYTVDHNVYKHGKFTPGRHIPIFHPDKIKESRPDYILILPWNVKDEIMDQLDISETGVGKSSFQFRRVGFTPEAGFINRRGKSDDQF